MCHGIPNRPISSLNVDGSLFLMFSGTRGSCAVMFMLFDQKQNHEKCFRSTAGVDVQTHLPAADDEVDAALKTTASAF